MALVIDIQAPPARAERNGVIRFIVRLFREKPLGAAGGVIFVLFLLCGLFADVLAPYGMNQISPRNRLLAPSWAYPFGTDNLGRDMLSRCLYGAQISVIIAFTAATLATMVSVAIGTMPTPGSLRMQFAASSPRPGPGNKIRSASKSTCARV